MKIGTILVIAGLVIVPVIGWAETTKTQIPVLINVTPPQTTTISATGTKCGVNSFSVSNECGLGVYKNVYVQCYDGYETNLGAVESSCKPAELWNQYANEACASHCSDGKEINIISKPLPTLLATPVSAPTIPGSNTGGGGGGAISVPTSSTPVPAPKPISVCYISDKLMQEYNQLILELQKSESDKVRAEEITQRIIKLKQEIAQQQNKCTNSQPVSSATPTAIENRPVAVAMDRCNEVVQWKTKIVYYTKLSDINNSDLKKVGFSREEIEKLLQELSLGLEKVKAQCSGQEKTPIKPRGAAITGSVSIAETVKPVVIESGPEISVYYKARLEKAVSVKGEEKQIQELKTLRDEIDGLISNLIKSRKELEVSELNTLVKEVKVSRGEIKADDIAVKTTEKKMLISIGDRPVSVEPTTSQVLIRDKGLEVNTAEVMIKENVLSVGGVDVKMSASEVTEKLGLVPIAIELKEENAKAIYNMKIDERRKLFGVIPFNSQKTIFADAENGNVLNERLPWYNFMTTK